MPDGLVLLGEDTIGTFTFEPWSHKTVRLQLKEGLRVRETFEHATENGIPISLMVVPEIPEGD